MRRLIELIISKINSDYLTELALLIMRELWERGEDESLRVINTDELWFDVYFGGKIND